MAFTRADRSPSSVNRRKRRFGPIGPCPGKACEFANKTGVFLPLTYDGGYMALAVSPGGLAHGLFLVPGTASITVSPVRAQGRAASAEAHFRLDLVAVRPQFGEVRGTPGAHEDAFARLAAPGAAAGDALGQQLTDRRFGSRLFRKFRCIAHGAQLLWVGDSLEWLTWLT
jgi:hypothetical protein